jgi:hypothetical protein
MTHLGESVDRIVNLVTSQLKNDNQSQPFYYDGDVRAPFDVPKGFSFVITDLIVNPATISFSSNQFFLVVITIDGVRYFEIRTDGHTAHYPLSGALIIPEKNTTSAKRLEVRNTTFSTGPVEAQILGYFVEVASGSAVGKPFIY